MPEGIIARLKAVLFPIFCVNCGAESDWWCRACRAKAGFISEPRCPVCQNLTLKGEACENCQAVSYLDGVTAFFAYAETGPVGRLIKQFKYAYASDISNLWEEIIREIFLNQPFPWETHLTLSIIPVPLYSRRERSRGFNQAELIASALGEVIDSPVRSDYLKRARATRQQAKLSRLERLVNVQGAFAWQSAKPPPDSVILVDDVFTTGATMQECARILKSAGTKNVWGFALARD